VLPEVHVVGIDELICIRDLTTERERIVLAGSDRRKMTVAASKKLTFAPAKALKDALNK
jgi:nucleoid DNA-binding protein